VSPFRRIVGNISGAAVNERLFIGPVALSRRTRSALMQHVPAVDPTNALQGLSLLSFAKTPEAVNRVAGLVGAATTIWRSGRSRFSPRRRNVQRALTTLASGRQAHMRADL
jgi:hypothetical protein